MQIGVLGLGKMGSRISIKLVEEGHDVIVWNRSQLPIDEFTKGVSGNAQIATSVEDLVSKLRKPRVIWLMLPAGNPTEDLLNEIAKHTEPEDIIIDGGNAFYKDTQRRFETFAIDTVRYLGIGVSGGIHAIQNGYPLMVGGTKSAYDHVIPLLDSLSKPRGGHEYFGEGGAGHFVKMIHNGIEYGMMQAIGEGFGVLDKGGYELDLSKVASLFQKSTIISGFLMDRTHDALKKDPELEHIDGVILASGEGQWTVEAGREEDVPVENIAQSVQFRERSQLEKEVSESFAARLVAALRHEFGGHPLRQRSEASEIQKK